MLVDSEQRPAKTIGRYALFAEIASGGMASVHVGQLLGPVGFSRTVAIKRLHPQFARDPEFVTMFLDEARLAARIRHPNVVPTLDVVATHGELFLVMEYVQGESLAQLARACLEAGKSVPHDIALAVMSGILHGLHAAHEAKSERGEPLGIVHRDVSPQNILVGTDGVARLADFGVAKAVGRAHITRDRHVKGKLSYMAPEQVQNTPVDRRVDVYAAAVVLWELLTGKRLFLADTDSSTLARVLSCAVAPPSSISPGVSFKLDRLVLRGVKRDPRDRFSTAREMAMALEASGRLATPSAVGEWVETIAHDALAARAAHISAVEQIDDLPPDTVSSRPLRPIADIGPDGIPTIVAPITGSDFLEDSSIELVPLSSPDAARIKNSDVSDLALSGKRRRRIVAAIGLFVALASLLVWVAVSRRPTVAAARQVPPASQSAAASDTASAEATTAQPAVIKSSAGASEPFDRSIAPGQSDVPEKLTASSQQTGNARSKARPVNCNPPYTLDAAGIRHYKRKCL